MFSIIFSICVFIFSKSFAKEACPIDFCKPIHEPDSKVETYCTNIIDGKMAERCCIANETVFGLDLRSCHIKRLHISKNNFSDLIIMDLRENELQKISTDDLMGLVNLNFLYLPEHIPCPGGNVTWDITSEDDNMTSCSFQNNPCNYLNISCTDNGDCIHTGPGSAKCICKPGHYGYKCMNEGEFPITIFSTTLTICTVILCIVLWFAQGRDVYKKR